MAGADAVVHAAWSFGPTRSGQGPVNVTGTRNLLAAARLAGIERVIVVSSMSAASHVDSRYGQQKRQIERMAADHGALIVRPGLVWSKDDDRGLVAGLRRASRLSVVPVPRVPDARLHLVSSSDLAAVVSRMLVAETPPTRIVVAHPEPLTIAEIVRRAGASRGRAPWCIPLPIRLCMAGLHVAEKAGAPFTPDNLRGLRDARPDVRLDPAPLGIALVPFKG
jgi:NADH dehydrogenase